MVLQNERLLLFKEDRGSAAAEHEYVPEGSLTPGRDAAHRGPASLAEPAQSRSQRGDTRAVCAEKRPHMGAKVGQRRRGGGRRALRAQLQRGMEGRRKHRGQGRTGEEASSKPGETGIERERETERERERER